MVEFDSAQKRSSNRLKILEYLYTNFPIKPQNFPIKTPHYPAFNTINVWIDQIWMKKTISIAQLKFRRDPQRVYWLNSLTVAREFLLMFETSSVFPVCYQQLIKVEAICSHRENNFQRHNKGKKITEITQRFSRSRVIKGKIDIGSDLEKFWHINSKEAEKR